MTQQSAQWTARSIRARFLDFFKDKDHQVVSSAPMVLKGDPTLMFTNAGMNQFKDYFLNNAQPTSTRIADTQKCLRVSGKHNDLEEVGHDTYHHTMFEMLGNWSIGDYYKKEAIAWAWELLTEVYGLDKNRLYVTVFEGDKKDKLPLDEEAREEWKKWIAEDRILTGDKSDNFWEMGATGPCGPSSEIHIDLRNDAERSRQPGHELVNQDHPLVVEIWNLVFMEFNRLADGSLKQLPAKHVDTGMGFERLCMALQGVYSNYDTDVFTPLIAEIEQISAKKYGSDDPTNVAMRVVADHVRAVAFAIADGQLPSNNGAGYVIRRILRRAIRYGFSYLDQKQAFIYRLIPLLRSQMEEFFPEIGKQQTLVEKVIREEEESFLRTLDQGLSRLDQIIASAESGPIDGAKVFELYDTYGFPPDLTALILREKGMDYDQSSFDREMAAQKSRARGAAQLDTGDWQVLESDDKEEFIGYDYLSTEVRITRFRKVKTKKKEQYHLVFNVTPFYPEGGGQVGDQGYLESKEGKLSIRDTKKEHGLILHVADQLPEDPTQTFQAVVHGAKREKAAKNHSATHLLHKALREILGDHVEQKGSLVHPDYLRFDFSHFSKIEKEELTQIEDRVNELIRANQDLQEFREVPMQQAQDMGAMALFGEKYGDTVRVIQFGESIELCGGTHVQATGEIGFFVIRQETAVAAGVRRLEALTGQGAMEYLREKTALINELNAELKNPKNMVEGVRNLKNENSKLKKQIEEFKAEKVGLEKKQLREKIEERDGHNVLIAKTALDGGDMKNLLFQLRAEVENFAGALASEANGQKPQIALIFNDHLVETKNWHAGKFVKQLAAEIKGGGGGQPGFAMAGGSDASGIDKALEKAQELLKN